MRRRFAFRMLIDGEYVGDNGIIELDQSVIDSVDDEWRSVFYPYKTPEDVAAHIAYNMVRWDTSLSNMEGFMMPDKLAQIIEYPIGYDDYECEATELFDVKENKHEIDF